MKALPLALLPALFLCISCDTGARDGADERVTKLGTIEVTAELVEVPPGAIFRRDLYDYATVLKYRVVKVHRGSMGQEAIYVGHYNPFKPRAQAADGRVKGIGGDVQVFTAGQMHRMAMEASIDEHYMGGIVNKYYGQHTGAIYWAVWTNQAR